MMRELGIHANAQDIDLHETICKAREARSRLLVITHNSPASSEWLRVFDDDSIVVIIASDETYLPNVTESWLSSPKVNSIFRPYSMHDVNLSRWLNVAGNASRDAATCGDLTLFRHWPRTALAGLVMAKRQRKLSRLEKSLGKKINSYPLGYTDVFYRSVLKFLRVEELDSDKSLIELAEAWESGGPSRSIRIGFAGQRGQMQRQTGIEVVSRMNSVETIISDEFQGFDGTDEGIRGARYVELLLKCHGTLSPPGNYSAECFRYMESLILGCLPIEIDSVLSDPGRRKSGLSNDLVPSLNTWREALCWFDRLAEAEIHQVVLSLRGLLKQQIITSRENFRFALQRD